MQQAFLKALFSPVPELLLNTREIGQKAGFRLEIFHHNREKTRTLLAKMFVNTANLSGILLAPEAS